MKLLEELWGYRYVIPSELRKSNFLTEYIMVMVLWGIINVAILIYSFGYGGAHPWLQPHTIGTWGILSVYIVFLGSCCLNPHCLSLRPGKKQALLPI